MSLIFAPITGHGGAVSVLRLSGTGAFEVLGMLVGTLPTDRVATLRALRHGGIVLDHALVTMFPGPRSFTGEDSVELSLHGGRAVLAAVSAALVALGSRPAEPGEFSRRAYLNGRLDLLAAEAMADLIASETEGQRRLAVEGAGGLQEACAGWREVLRQIMARQEALIDFPDEGLPVDVERLLVGQIAGLRGEMLEALNGAPAAERLRTGLNFVILGPPNAGKSTLMNALAGEDFAIVSPTPGTTRDAIGVRLDLGGIPVQLTDTAGLRESEDPIEAEGVARSRSRAAGADLILALAPQGEAFPETPPGVRTLQVRTKADLHPGISDAFAISAVTGAGLAELRDRLVQAAIALTETTAPAALSRPRQVACLRDTAEALALALEADEPELRAEDLRAAATALARLTGTVGVEEILDAVFSGFCIGK